MVPGRSAASASAKRQQAAQGLELPLICRCQASAAPSLMQPSARAPAVPAVQVFQKLQQGSEPGNPLVRQRWARLFLRPSVDRVPDACELLLTAGVGMLKAGAPAAHIRGGQA